MPSRASRKTGDADDSENSPFTALVALFSGTRKNKSIGSELRNMLLPVSQASSDDRHKNTLGVGKTITKWSRQHLSKAAEKGCDDGDASLSLGEAAAGLAIVVPMQRGLAGAFSELELEKLIYHLVANACERGKKNLVAQGLGILSELMSEHERSKAVFLPPPGEKPSTELARLVSGALLNGIRCAASEATPELNMRDLLESSFHWLRAMHDSRDPRTTDYVGRVCKMVSVAAHRAVKESALQLYSEILRFRWVLSTTPIHAIFAEAHAVGVKAQKDASLGNGELLAVVKFYQRVHVIVDELPRATDSAWAHSNGIGLLHFVKWVLHFSTLCSKSNLLEHSSTVLASALKRVEDCEKGGVSPVEPLLRSVLLFTRFAAPFHSDELNTSVLTNTTGIDLASLNEASASLSKALTQLLAERQAGGEAEADEVVTSLLVTNWRMMTKLPAWASLETPLSANPDLWSEALVGSLKQLGGLSEYMLKISDHPKAQELTASMTPPGYDELRRLRPHLRSSIVESMTKVASLLTTLKCFGSPEDNALAAVASLRCAEAAMKDDAHFQRVSFAYNNLGKSLVDSHALPARAVLPLLRAVAVLEQRIVTDSAPQTSKTDAKVAARLLSLGNVLLRCGEQAAAAKVLRHAIMRSLPGVEMATLVDRFVSAQVMHHGRGEGGSSCDIPAEVVRELRQQPYMAPLPGDEEALHATQGFLALPPILPLHAGVSVLDEMRALNVALEKNAENKDSHAFVEKLLPYHEHLMSEISANESAASNISLDHSVALGLSGAFYKTAACSVCHQYFLASFHTHEQLDTPEVCSNQTDTLVSAAVVKGSSPARSWIKIATSRISQGIDALEKHAASPECMHAPGVVALELGCAHLARGLLWNTGESEGGELADGSSGRLSFDSALTAFTEAVHCRQPARSNGKGATNGSTCACLLCSRFTTGDGQTRRRLSAALCALGDQFALATQVWEQVNCFLLNTRVHASLESPQLSNQQGPLVAYHVATALAGSSASAAVLHHLCSFLDSLPAGHGDSKKAEMPLNLGEALAHFLLDAELTKDLSKDRIDRLLELSKERALPSSETRSRLRCVGHVVAAEAYGTRLGDRGLQLAVLREAASLCGGKVAGRFIRCNGGLFLHDVNPVHQESWWWLQQYVHILVQIGDTWSRRGSPSKALQYMGCALRLAAPSAPLRLSCEVCKLSVLLKQAKLEQVESAIASLGTSFGGAVSLQHLREGDIKKGSAVAMQLRFLVAKGDLLRRRGVDTFADASACYDAAAELLDLLQKELFVLPLLDVLPSPSLSPLPPLLGREKRLCTELAGDVMWRLGRMKSLAGSHHEAMEMFARVTESPGSSEAHARAHYRLGCHSLLSLASESRSDDSQRVGRSHLWQALTHALPHAHTKLLRNILRTLAVHTPPANAEWRSWLLCRSIGMAFSDGLLSKLRTSSRPDQAHVSKALNAAMGPPDLKGRMHDAAGLEIGQGLQKNIDMLPSEWVVCALSVSPQGHLIVTRLQANRRPVVQVSSQNAKNGHIRDTLAAFDSCVQRNRESLGGPSEQSSSRLDRKQKADWWERRQNIDDDLLGIVASLEQHLGTNKSLLCGEIVGGSFCVDDIVERLATSSGGARADGAAVDRDLLRTLIAGASSLSVSELEQAFEEAGVSSDEIQEAVAMSSAASCDKPSSNPSSGEDDCGAEDILKLKVAELRSRLLDLDQPTAGLKKDLVERLRSALLEEKKSAAEPTTPKAVVDGGMSPVIEKRGAVILVLDEVLQRLPWESMSFLSRCPVSRVPSLSCVLYHGLRAPRGVAPTAGARQQVFEGVQLQNAHFILDPNDNLPRSKAALGPLFKAMGGQLGWSGTVGETTSEESIRNELSSKDLVVYCGHGAGEQLIRREVVEKLPDCAAVLLMGCSSGRLQFNGDFEPAGMCTAFLSAGCPALVANLWDVTDKDIDLLTLKLLVGWAKNPGLSLLEALASSRDVCKFRYLNGSAPVCYGLPVFSTGDTTSFVYNEGADLKREI